MDVSLLTLLMLAAVFIASVLLAIICLDCGNKSPLASISQTAASEEYVPSSGFIVIHPCQSRPNQNPISPSLTLPPSLADRGSLRPYTPTETESNQSYENPVPGTDNPDSDGEGNGYIKVLPEATPSRTSTPSSDHNYVNVVTPKPESEPESDSESDPDSEPNYLNVEDMDQPGGRPAGSSQGDDDDDDDEDNYVNQPPVGWN